MSKESICLVVKHETDSNIGPAVTYEQVPVSEWQGVAGEKLLTHSYLMETFRKLMGKTLTIVDASISEKRQNKAIKDLVRNMFSEEMEFNANMVFDQQKLAKLASVSFEKAVKEGKDVSPISIEEALGVGE